MFEELDLTIAEAVETIRDDKDVIPKTYAPNCNTQSMGKLCC